MHPRRRNGWLGPLIVLGIIFSMVSKNGAEIISLVFSIGVVVFLVYLFIRYRPLDAFKNSTTSFESPVIRKAPVEAKPKSRQCVYCGSVLSVEAPACPRCGAPNIVEHKGGQAAFDVTLQKTGNNKIEVIKVIRALSGASLLEAKILTDAPGGVILSGVTKESAETARRLLEAAGATVEVC